MPTETPRPRLFTPNPRALWIAGTLAIGLATGCDLSLDGDESSNSTDEPSDGDGETGGDDGSATSATGAVDESDSSGSADGSSQDTAADEETGNADGDSTDSGEDPMSVPSCTSIDDDACNGESCCTALEVDASEAVELGNVGPLATVSSFRLDKYEVTVGRFRRFVEEYDAWRDSGNPSADSGANPNVEGSGWQSDPAWEGQLAQSEAVLREAIDCSDNWATWTDDVGDNELLPMNCVSWFEAFAFCAWDGGRLPSEIEWEYVAAGGAQDREYPWGNTNPNADFAVYSCLGSGGSSCSFDDIVAVGSRPDGNGRWGHADLGGSMEEWVLDWSDAFPEEPPMDYSNVESGQYRGTRGGHWDDGSTALQSDRRTWDSPSDRHNGLGFRCARDVQ